MWVVTVVVASCLCAHRAVHIGVERGRDRLYAEKDRRAAVAAEVPRRPGV